MYIKSTHHLHLHPTFHRLRIHGCRQCVKKLRPKTDGNSTARTCVHTNDKHSFSRQNLYRLTLFQTAGVFHDSIYRVAQQK